MAIKIGHSAIDENGKISGGQAGDNNGREVLIAVWYDKGWNVVLRPKNPILADKSAKFVEQICANDNVGYDQNQRNTLYPQAKAVNFDGSKIVVPCECDCSSFMHVAVIAGGANITYGSNGLTTRTLKNALVNSGDYELLTDSKYLTSDEYLKRGDIVIKEGSHTIMILEDGEKVKEKSTTVEFKVGDVVNFTGSTHYTSAYSGGIAKNCTPGQATVEQIVEGKPHPYLLKAVSGKGSTVHGWVNANDVKEISNESSVDTKPSTSSKNIIGTAVAKSTMKMRKASNTLSKVVGYVSAGSTIEVLEVLSNNWYKVVCPKEECGYAYVSNAGNRYFTYTENKTNNTSSTKKYVSNGVDYTLVFNPTYYANKYADLKKAFGADEKKLFNHFLNYGMKEARQACATFNVTVYKNTYADLRKAFGNNLPAYYKHYVQFGHKEGRKTV
jgi:hypothetical protein